MITIKKEKNFFFVHLVLFKFTIDHEKNYDGTLEKFIQLVNIIVGDKFSLKKTDCACWAHGKLSFN
jgi:hypothetical protein